MRSRKNSILGWAKARRAPRPRGRSRWALFALPALPRLADRLASSVFGRLLFRSNGSVRSMRPGVGLAAVVLLVAGGIGYGLAARAHIAVIVDAMHDMRDALANAAGFRISTIALSGNRQITREEILATAGVTGRTSLLFFDVDAARAKLKANPWIADATVLKLYPDRLQIGIKERAPFALWQFDRKVSVIADDGTVLEPYVARRFMILPFVVGRGAQTRAKEFLSLLSHYPAIKQEVRASVMVAQRRWNLYLKTGLEIRLPETGVARALEHLVALERDDKILSRDIVSVDLRLPDRVAVRLSDDAAKAREDALKAAKKNAKRKGGDA